MSLRAGPAVFVILEDCPTPCGAVVLLKRRDTGALIGFCACCGAGWSAPRSASVNPSLNLAYHPRNYAPAGVDFPTWDDVTSAGLVDIVLRTIASEEWNGELTELNRWIAGLD